MEIFAGSELQVHPKTYLCLAHSIWCGLVPAWDTRRLVGLPGSLKLQNSSLTSHWPKHNPRVTLLYTPQVCSSDDEAEKQVWRLGRERCLCSFQHIQENKGGTRAGGGQAPSPLPVYIWGQWQGQDLLESARKDRSSCSSNGDPSVPVQHGKDRLWGWLNSLLLPLVKPSRKLPPKEDTRHCWKSLCPDGNHKKCHFFLRYLPFTALFRGSIEKAPVGNKEKCVREEQVPVVLGSVQIQSRHSHYAKSRGYKTLMASLWIPC